MESGLAGPGLRLVWAWQLRGAAACFNTVAAEMRSHLAGLYGDHAPSLLRGLVVRVKRKVRGRRLVGCLPCPPPTHALHGRAALAVHGTLWHAYAQQARIKFSSYSSVLAMHTSNLMLPSPPLR